MVAGRAATASVESRPMRTHRRLIGLTTGLAALLVSLAAAAASPERVLVTTSFGSFTIELQRDRAPLTVDNFLGYVRSGYYTNTQFHRVIANFLIQGGGVGIDYKAKPTGKPIANEAGNGLKNLRGTVGLARASGPHTGDAQFFVNVVDNPDLDPLPTRWGYAVFGRVVEGMEVVDRISVSPTGAAGPYKADAPLRPVVIQKVEILAEAPGAAAPTPAPAPMETPASVPPAAERPAESAAPPPAATPADGKQPPPQ
jgi:cyclophilin family peptidyl-prolyl cis-trans isomerase